jgi:hypothetical protein
MSYIVNTNTFANNFTPPKRRTSKMLAWVKTLLYPLQVLYDTMFGTYKDGNTAADYDNSTTYAIGDQVKYTDKAIYQNYVSSTGVLPTNTSYWFKVQDNFVGIEPRMKYNSQHIVLEWALNEWFGTTFVNTPSDSDIYIINNTNSDTTFWVGAVENESSLVVANNADIFGWIQAEDISQSFNYFTIFVPIAVANALTSEAPDSVPNISTNRANIIKKLADTYVLAGITYNVETY